MEAELKVVIQMKGDRALVGVQGSDTDPVLELVHAGDLDSVLVQIPAVVARARARWTSTPKNPAYQRPEPPVPVATARPALRAPAAKSTGGEAVHRPSLFDD